MKRSEFKAWIDTNLGGTEDWFGEQVATMAERHGAKWDAEELLPKKVEIDGRWSQRMLAVIVDACNRLQAGELVEKDSSDSQEWKKVPLLDKAGSFIALPPGVRVGSPACDAFILTVKRSMCLQQRIKEAMEYLDPSDTVYRILNGEEP